MSKLIFRKQLGNYSCKVPHVFIECTVVLSKVYT